MLWVSVKCLETICFVIDDIQIKLNWTELYPTGITKTFYWNFVYFYCSSFSVMFYSVLTESKQSMIRDIQNLLLTVDLEVEERDHFQLTVMLCKSTHAGGNIIFYFVGSLWMHNWRVEEEWKGHLQYIFKLQRLC